MVSGLIAIGSFVIGAAVIIVLCLAALWLAAFLVCLPFAIVWGLVKGIYDSLRNRYRKSLVRRVAR